MAKGRITHDYDHTCHLLYRLEVLLHSLQLIFLKEDADPPDPPELFQIHPFRSLEDMKPQETPEEHEARVLAAKLGQMRFLKTSAERIAAFRAAHGVPVTST